MSVRRNLIKALGLAAAIAVVSAGSAFAAVAMAPVNVRTGPGLGYHVVDTLYPGEYVSVVDRSGRWCAVRKLGPDGWVVCAYLSGFDRFVRPGITLRFDRMHRAPMFMSPGGFMIY